MDAFANMTAFDAVILIIMGFSAITGFAKGFSTEVLSLGAWVGAAFITLYGVDPVTSYMEAYIQPAMLAGVISVVGLFVLSLAILKMLAGFVGDSVKSSAVGALDRSLGALFGLIRGLLIVFAAYLVFSYMVPIKKQPDYVRNANLIGLVEYGSDMLTVIVPDLFSRGEERDELHDGVDDILKDMKNRLPSKDQVDGLKKNIEDAAELKKMMDEVEAKKKNNI